MKLPKRQLPSFSGSNPESTSFVDRYRASLDSNTQLTNSEELNYLRLCLKGNAAKVRGSVMITDAIYKIALTPLREMYENKFCLVQTHLKMICTEASMGSESGLGSRKI